MAIEPISSVMTAQAQGSAMTKPQTVSTVEKTTNETPSGAEKIDLTTKVVENTQSKGAAKDGENAFANEQANEQATNEQIRKAVEQLNKSMNNSEAVFGFHEGTNRVTIKLVDKNTKEVIKELPPEKTLDMIARVWDMAGILVDERR